MQTGKRDHVHGQFSQISIQLAWKPEASSDPWHGKRHQMIEISIGGCSQFQGSEANVIQGLIIDAECFICVLNQLVDGQGCIIRLHNSVRDFGGRNNRVAVHDSVRVFLPYFGDQKGSHPWSGSTSEWMCKLKALETVASFCLSSCTIKNTINKLSTCQE